MESWDSGRYGSARSRTPGSWFDAYCDHTRDLMAVSGVPLPVAERGTRNDDLYRTRCRGEGERMGDSEEVVCLS